MHDQIFGFYSMLLDFDAANISEADIAKLRSGIENNYPGALPDTRVSLFHRTGVEVSKPQAFSEATTIVGRKLACALYYREARKALTTGHSIVTGWHQMQNSGAAPLTEYFAQLLPDQTVGSRSNIKRYGQRFAYVSGVKKEEEFFAYTAQFGMGLIVWGIATTEVILGEPLRSMAWPVRGFGGGSGPQGGLASPDESRGR
jgi:hypothetical protein